MHPFIKEGIKYMCKPYYFGATVGETDTFDCSSFVAHVAKEVADIDLPRTSANQYKAGEAVEDSDLKQGDLLFWEGTGDHNDGITHVAFHFEDDHFLGAQRSTGVAIADGSTDYWQSRYVGARRLIDEEGNKLGKDATTTHAEPGQMIRVVADSVNYRDKASWDSGAVSGSAKKGEAFTVVARHEMEDRSDLYELKSGVFITTHPSYVEVVE